MQKRHIDRKLYFQELAKTSNQYFLPYISQFISVTPQSHILEIGCGEGGNLFPFAQMGCQVTGIDLSTDRINEARQFFQEEGLQGDFISSDIFNIKDFNKKYDIIIIHDVIEHIGEKKHFFDYIKQFIAENGLIFMGFPAWQMPFGGHQQLCSSKICSRLPFIHLLPSKLYASVLRMFGESKPKIDELLETKRTGISIEQFERLMQEADYKIMDKEFWLINPHYEQKFGLKPRKLPSFIRSTPHFRNYFCTSCFYLLKM